MANYDAALQVAMDRFLEKDPWDMAVKSGAAYDRNDDSITVKFMGKDHVVDCLSAKSYVLGSDGERSEPSLAARIVVLHYLAGASGLPLSDRLISYKEIPNGRVYYDAFVRRAINPLTSIFGGSPEKLKMMVEQYGGSENNLGDVSVTIPVFPLVPVTYVLWRGDDEFPASGNVLFDASAPSHLHAEDLALLPSMPLWEIRQRLK